MKALAIACVLVLGPVSVMACPNLQGEWCCTDSNGEKWTESIVKEGNKFIAVIDKGTKDESKEEWVADGIAREITSGVVEQTRHAVGRALDKLAALLPQSLQSAT